MVASAKQIKMEQEFEYDAFISYNPRNDQDSLWIIEYLIPELEGKSGDQVCCLLMLSVYSVEHQSILLLKAFLLITFELQTILCSEMHLISKLGLFLTCAIYLY